ncbi:hypothetical protein ACFWNE_07705 [Streptomyces goshikiensis]|uniref:hypothetical protein n=1 Tax=Streptomyces goshikiensis TaxID=1942 RepID=UPI003649F193
MGIRLIVEVLTSAPMVLTHREKLLLVVLAEDANDDTRVTWNSVEDPKFRVGAKLSSRAQLYAVIKTLIQKGVLSREAAGQKNAVAKYKLAPFAPSQCQGFADTETGSQRPEIPDTEAPQSPRFPDTDTAGQCQGFADTDKAQCQENADTEDSQCQEIRDVSVRDSGTPTPLTPLKEEEEEASSSAMVEQHLEAFGAFWLNYPKKIDRGRAKTEWIAAMHRGEDPALIVERAQAYARSVADESNPRFIAYPANWLAKERYHDEYPEAPAGQPNLRIVDGQKHQPFRLNPNANYANGF